MAEPVRKVRHWKQRFDPKAQFRFRRGMLYDNVFYEPGEPIPPALQGNKRKLRDLWDAGRIELSLFEEGPKVDPNAVEVPDHLSGEVTGIVKKGSYFTVTFADGSESKFQGRAALDEFLEPPEETEDGEAA